MNAIADLQAAINGIIAARLQKETEAKEKETEQQETKETSRNETVRGIAKKFADKIGGGVDVANQIIEKSIFTTRAKSLTLR
jgi:hypothetical protein